MKRAENARTPVAVSDGARGQTVLTGSALAVRRRELVLAVASGPVATPRVVPTDPYTAVRVNGVPQGAGQLHAVMVGDVVRATLRKGRAVAIEVERARTMPPLETMDRPDDAVYWPREGVDGYGQPKIGSAVAKKVRWVETRRDELSPTGERVPIVADVVVDFAISVGDFLYFGSIDDLVGTGFGDTPTDIYQVSSIKTARDLNGRVTRREAAVARYRSSLPEEA